MTSFERAHAHASVCKVKACMHKSWLRTWTHKHHHPARHNRRHRRICHHSSAAGFLDSLVHRRMIFQCLRARHLTTWAYKTLVFNAYFCFTGCSSCALLFLIPVLLCLHPTPETCSVPHLGPSPAVPMKSHHSTQMCRNEDPLDLDLKLSASGRSNIFVAQFDKAYLTPEELSRVHIWTCLLCHKASTCGLALCTEFCLGKLNVSHQTSSCPPRHSLALLPDLCLSYPIVGL